MITRKQKHISKKSEKSHKKVQNVKNQFENFRFNFSGTCFRLLAFQPLSLLLELSIPFELSIQNIKCRLALQPAHSDKSSQLTHGGTFIVIEFSTEESTDLFPATQIGLDLIEDFFAAVSLVEGATCPGRGASPNNEYRPNSSPRIYFYAFS